MYYNIFFKIIVRRTSNVYIEMTVYNVKHKKRLYKFYVIEETRPFTELQWPVKVNRGHGAISILDDEVDFLENGQLLS